VDFSWVKELAEQANDREAARQERDRRDKEEQRQLAVATAPFVEKLHLLIATCAEEFNKYTRYQNLRISATRILKRNKGVINAEDPELMYNEESTSFCFTRKDWTYGIRGSKGLVEFLELPSTGVGLNLDDVGATPSRKLEASLDNASQQIIWKYQGQVMDGQSIVALCKEYVKEFIERTNP
jgi:hypothetical protein